MNFNNTGNFIPLFHCKHVIVMQCYLDSEQEEAGQTG